MTQKEQEWLSKLINGMRDDITFIRNNMVTKATCAAVREGQERLEKRKQFDIRTLLIIANLIGILFLGGLNLYERNAAHTEPVQPTRIEDTRTQSGDPALDWYENPISNSSSELF